MYGMQEPVLQKPDTYLLHIMGPTYHGKQQCTFTTAFLLAKLHTVVIDLKTTQPKGFSLESLCVIFTPVKRGKVRGTTQAGRERSGVMLIEKGERD